MRIAYLDCFAGIAGDMFLAALIDAGVPPQVLHEATAALGVGATLRIGKVDRSGISATKVDVLEGDRLAEQVPQDANVYTQQSTSAAERSSAPTERFQCPHLQRPTCCAGCPPTPRTS